MNGWIASHFHFQYIPVAQKLIDTLKDPNSDINRTQGAPDPTAGPTDDTPAVWCMDERALHAEVRKMLINFMRPSAMVWLVAFGMIGM